MIEDEERLALVAWSISSTSESAIKAKAIRKEAIKRVASANWRHEIASYSSGSFPAKMDSSGSSKTDASLSAKTGASESAKMGASESAKTDASCSAMMDSSGSGASNSSHSATPAPATAPGRPTAPAAAADLMHVTSSGFSSSKGQPAPPLSDAAMRHALLVQAKTSTLAMQKVPTHPPPQEPEDAVAPAVLSEAQLKLSREDIRRDLAAVPPTPPAQQAQKLKVMLAVASSLFERGSLEQAQMLLDEVRVAVNPSLHT
ncbi:hypothetical protein AB1Y20_007973 [Prymnesium parvum]|uniref:Vta1 C-terminal domain-containing protein n=1 Tax=Prymnesium parvum TaxID=97485 RepID=A0AB34IVF2_PRYPA